MIRRNPLFFAFLLPAVVDGFLTLFGQSKNYWQNTSLVNEASPVYVFLVLSPWLFILGSVVWFLIWYRVIKAVKEPFNFGLMFLFIAGHSWGSGSWIWKLIKESYFYQPNNRISIMIAWGLVVFYFIVIATIAGYCLRLYNKKKN